MSQKRVSPPLRPVNCSKVPLLYRTKLFTKLPECISFERRKPAHDYNSVVLDLIFQKRNGDCGNTLVLVRVQHHSEWIELFVTPHWFDILIVEVPVLVASHRLSYRVKLHKESSNGKGCVPPATASTPAICVAATQRSYKLSLRPALGKQARTQVTLQRAIEVAHEADALNKAGLAALTMIEEVDRLSPNTLQAAYQQAREWLADSQSREVLSRLSAAGGKLADSLCREMPRDEAVDALLTKPLDFDQRLLECEHETIKQALAQTDGSVVHVAPLIGRTYQGLAHMIEVKHPDLIEKRTPVRRRPKETPEESLKMKNLLDLLTFEWFLQRLSSGCELVFALRVIEHYAYHKRKLKSVERHITQRS